MAKGNIRHIFPGGNTSLGFFSYYDYILPQDEAAHIFILKGGPGTGKSTFMKKIAYEMTDRGYNVEFMHCSSDPNSLDGIVIPAAKIAFIDGTSPHVVDPKNPGAVDEIIHLGDFWDENGVKENRIGITNDNREIGRYFARAYKYIKAAAALYEDIIGINALAVDNAAINLKASLLIGELMGGVDVSCKEGKQRHLFASAITPEGYKNYLPSILTTERVYSLVGNPGTGTEKFLEKIRAAAVERGFHTESYYCALNPRKLEHLIIPTIDVSFTTINEYHDSGIPVYEEIDFNYFLDEKIIRQYKEELEYNKTTFDALMNKGISTIAKAKALHDRLETYYIPNMDFDAIQRCRESTLARVLEYTGDV